MKFYLASENKGNAIRIANVINNSGNTCILSDTDSSDYRAIIKDLRENANDYDFSILVSSDPISAAIEANRIGMRAFACKDPEDAGKAASANVNLIVLDGTKLGRINVEAIIDSCLSQENRAKRPDLQRKMGGFVGSIKDTFIPDTKPVREAKQKQKENEGDEEDYYEDQQRRKGRRGLFGSLKETFGVD